jgi:hypothetical protein
MKIERFEDLRAWQLARELANLVYDVTEKGKLRPRFQATRPNPRRGWFGDAQYFRRLRCRFGW